MRKKSFTLIEVLLVVVIIAILAGIVIVAVNPLRMILGTNESRASAELLAIRDALYMYYYDNRKWPDDVSRGLPNGIEENLGAGEWPMAPFNDVSEYDWDNFIGSDGKQVLQISIRFCPLGRADQCEFPDADWAENFDYYSSYYFCIQGKCRAHPDKPDNHPGHCVNCGGSSSNP
ncbi:MAG: type II secretion system protein [Candidatus Gracilibacteria bacterium]